jgi:hypothetical protein
LLERVVSAYRWTFLGQQEILGIAVMRGFPVLGRSMEFGIRRRDLHDGLNEIGMMQSGPEQSLLQAQSGKNHLQQQRYTQDSVYQKVSQR